MLKFKWRLLPIANVCLYTRNDMNIHILWDACMLLLYFNTLFSYKDNALHIFFVYYG